MPHCSLCLSNSHEVKLCSELVVLSKSQLPLPEADHSSSHKMELFVCGDNPLVEPTPCPRHYEDKSNRCSHVPSGQVLDAEHEACPYMATTPHRIFANQKRIEIRQMGIENVLSLEDYSDKRTIHCRDGYDRTLEEATIPLLQDQISDEDQQDIWIDTKMNVSEDDEDDDGFGDDLFGDDYPKGPVVELGLLHRNGAIYNLKQQPFSLTELTTPESRKPFLHAIFRQECSNGKGDVWPSVVFPEQPAVLYRLRNVSELLDWLRGDDMQYKRIVLSSPVLRLVASRSRAQQCIAVTEDGKVFHWRRDDESAGSHHTSSLQEALVTFPSGEEQHGERKTDDPSEAAYMDISPTLNVALGLSMGAAVSKTGSLYVFSLTKSTKQDLYTPHIVDLDDGTQHHRTPGLFVARLASINADDRRFVGVAAGDDHLVALTSKGEVYTIGSGFQGALGIGEKQFELDNHDPKAFEWTHDCVQFSEDWQELSLPKLKENSRIDQVAAGYQSTILVSAAV